MRRFLLFAHRWLGIGIGLIMVLWCLSGFVMMYMPYPEISRSQLLQGKAVVDLGGCCDTSGLDALGLVDVHRFTVTMLAGELVLQVTASGGAQPLLRLSSGKPLHGLDENTARAVAEGFQARSGIDGELGLLGMLERDQWTVSGAFNRHRPLYKFAAGDAQGSEWYISSRTGEVVQFTTARQRFWNWLGAVPHWLYPTFLRQFPGLWAQVVIILSLAGVFLTAIGLYVGISRYRRLPSGRHSPFRGLALWHHYAGLLFGLFILSWVASGLFSMRPWGWFDSRGAPEVARRLEGVPLYSDEVAELLKALPQAQLPADTVQVEGHALLGKLYLLLHQRDGRLLRLDGRTLAPQPLAAEDWSQIAARAAGGKPIREAGLLKDEDSYYYAGHDLKGELPVYRIILDDAEQTRIYLDRDSGELAAFFDAAEKRYRWLFAALHRFDVGWLRSRPLWDMLVWILMLGVTTGTVSGTLMGWRYLRRKRQ